MTNNLLPLLLIGGVVLALTAALVTLAARALRHSDEGLVAQSPGTRIAALAILAVLILGTLGTGAVLLFRDSLPASLPFGRATAVVQSSSVTSFPEANAAATPQGGSPVPAPSPGLAPSPDAAALPTPYIQSFTTSVGIARPGDTIQLSWAATGGILTLYRFGGEDRLIPLDLDPPLAGSLPFVLDATARGDVSFVLEVRAQPGDEDRLDSRLVSVRIEAPCEGWYFSDPPEVCADGPAMAGASAYQRFQRGLMIWFGPGRTIYLLYDDPPAWQALNDQFTEGQPESDPDLQPPDGLYQPVRGFGLVWRTGTSPGGKAIRDAIGWAVELEVEFQSRLQCDGLPEGESTTCYLEGPDGTLLVLPNSGPWHPR